MKALVHSILLITLFFSGVSTVSAETIVFGSITEDTVWTLENSPYVVDSLLDIEASLTIEAGVVVKASFAPQISNYGVLVVQGTPEAPVYFTSYADDSVGGDTNADGDASGPAVADWVGIANFGTVQIAHAVIKYAEVGLDNAGGTAAITHTIFSNNGLGVGVGSFGEGTTFSNNTISNNGPSGYPATGLWNRGTQQFDARDNDWGDALGPHHPTLNPSGLGDSVAGDVLFDPWVGKAQTIDPVIIIPGILGSWEKNGEWVIDPLFGVYNDLVDTLAANGYVHGQDLFTFPYNWRNSNVETALLLKEKINEVQDVCECQKVDLVAHSMGGLVARQYIQSDGYENDVDQMIFLGTPHLGAPKAYRMWETGQQAAHFTDVFDRLFDVVFKNEAQENGFSNVLDYIRLSPILSVQELLPVFSYLTDSDSLVLREYPTGYPVNNFLEQLNANKNILLERTRVVNVVGEVTDGTINGYIVAPSDELPKWEHGKPTENGIVGGAGDGTVPFISAASVSPTFLNTEAEHVVLVSTMAGEVYFLLTQKEPTDVINEGFDVDRPLLLVQLLSPVDMQIIAPDGKRLGKDFESEGEVDEISDAFYSGFNGDNEYAIILNPVLGEYQIKTVGTGGGSYTVVVDYSDLENSYSTEVTKEVAEGQEDEHKLVLGGGDNMLKFLEVPAEEDVVIGEPPVEEEILTGSSGGRSRSSGQILGASASRFTPEQVEAILNLLRAFGVSEEVIAGVAVFL